MQEVTLLKTRILVKILLKSKERRIYSCKPFLTYTLHYTPLYLVVSITSQNHIDITAFVQVEAQSSF